MFRVPCKLTPEAGLAYARLAADQQDAARAGSGVLPERVCLGQFLASAYPLPPHDAVKQGWGSVRGADHS